MAMRIVDVRCSRPASPATGNAAEGNPALNAPSLATTDDWYQVRQLQLFKQGLRGAHADDTYGQQMRPMAGLLADDSAINDVVSYINSLK